MFINKENGTEILSQNSAYIPRSYQSCALDTGEKSGLKAKAAAFGWQGAGKG